MSNKKYDWIELKHKYLLGNNISMREFCEKNDVNWNATSRQKMKGWAEEKRQIQTAKTAKTIEKTIEKISEKEASRNAKHLEIWDKILDRISCLSDKDDITVMIKGKPVKIDTDHKALMHLATAMEKVQKGHRVAEGIDNPQESSSDNLNSLIDAIKSSKKSE